MDPANQRFNGEGSPCKKSGCSRIQKIIELSFGLLAAPLFLYSLYLIFMVVPDERTMGAVQRIFYLHVPSAFASYVAIAVLFVASLGYLITANRTFDKWNIAALEVAFLFCTIVLISGMIWGKSAWNTAFRLEPRLVSFLFVWFILLSGILLRAFGDSSKIASHAAVLGICATLSIPLMIYSVNLLPAVAQLHPQVIQRGGLADADMRFAFAIASLAVIFLQGFLVCFRARLAILLDE